MRFLLSNGAYIDAQNMYGNTSLHEACRQGFVSAIELLLDSGANVNVSNKKGSNPLHFICYDDESKQSLGLSIGRMLVRYGANVNARDSRGLTPLLVCCSTGRFIACT